MNVSKLISTSSSSPLTTSSDLPQPQTNQQQPNNPMSQLDGSNNVHMQPNNQGAHINFNPTQFIPNNKEQISNNILDLRSQLQKHQKAFHENTALIKKNYEKMQLEAMALDELFEKHDIQIERHFDEGIGSYNAYYSEYVVPHMDILNRSKSLSNESKTYVSRAEGALAKLYELNDTINKEHEKFFPNHL